MEWDKQHVCVTRDVCSLAVNRDVCIMYIDVPLRHIHPAFILGFWIGGHVVVIVVSCFFGSLQCCVTSCGTCVHAAFVYMHKISRDFHYDATATIANDTLNLYTCWSGWGKLQFLM